VLPFAKNKTRTMGTVVAMVFGVFVASAMRLHDQPPACEPHGWLHTVETGPVPPGITRLNATRFAVGAGPATDEAECRRVAGTASPLLGGKVPVSCRIDDEAQPIVHVKVHTCDVDPYDLYARALRAAKDEGLQGKQITLEVRGLRPACYLVLCGLSR